MVSAEAPQNNQTPPVLNNNPEATPTASLTLRIAWGICRIPLDVTIPDIRCWIRVPCSLKHGGLSTRGYVRGWQARR